MDFRMATHYVLCPCCGRNHCGESAQSNEMNNKVCAVSGEEEECRICRITNAYRRSELRDFGKNHSDCRFAVPLRLSHYHRQIPGYGDAVDFDLSVHPWNCAGHAHCKHGMLGTIEERAMTMLRDRNQKYRVSHNNCVCQRHPSTAHYVCFPEN